MASKKKLLQAAAGAAGGAGLDVDEVFSTYLYTGTAGASTAAVVTNGIDLSGEGGLVWTKQRNGTEIHYLTDTERGGTKYVRSNDTNQEGTQPAITFNSNGFSQAFYTDTMDIASWTFRKAPKFFDVVTYTGTGVNRTISHGLGSTPGMILVKRTDASTDWACYHRGLNGGTSPATKFIRLNLNAAESANSGYWNNTEPTDSVFTLGANANTNANGAPFVAYLFAHNNGDGDFGPDSDQDIIECGYYTGNSNGEHDDNGTEVNLGFEPQWIMIKSRTWSSGDWQIFDTMRGITARPTSSSRDGDDAVLFPNQNYAEDGASSFLRVTPTGFKLESDSFAVNSSSHSYIYVAIRRGPLAEPESATDVFAMDTRGSTGDGLAPAFRSSFPVDMGIERQITGSDHWGVASRLTQSRFTRTSSTAAEASGSAYDFDYMNGWYDTTSTNTSFYSWMWKRAPSYFDVVTFTGTGATAQTINHNLGAVPEMMWLKRRDNAQAWQVYHSGLNSGTDPEDYYLTLNATSTETDNSNRWNDTAPTATQFTVNGAIASNGATFVMYLFASLDGISKVSHYTGNGADGHQIDCGFSSGARFVLIKRVDSANDWMVFDTERGIVSGNDSYLRLNLSNAENTATDLIDPYSSGFAVNNDAKVNTSGGRYVFYAIA